MKITKHYFDTWAGHYDISPLQYLVFKVAHEKIFNEMILLPIHFAHGRILDVGCGTGKLAYKLAQCLPKTKIDGLDLSTKMLQKAIAKNPLKNLRFKEGNVEKLYMYWNDIFDVVTCCHSFHHYINKSKALKEMRRVLKPGGIVMIVDGCKDTLLGRIIFTLVEKIEKNVYHLTAPEMKDLLLKNKFKIICQKRFNFIPLLLTIATVNKRRVKYGKY